MSSRLININSLTKAEVVTAFVVYGMGIVPFPRKYAMTHESEVRVWMVENLPRIYTSGQWGVTRSQSQSARSGDYTMEDYSDDEEESDDDEDSEGNFIEEDSDEDSDEESDGDYEP